jgi:hypothetical protein
MKSMSEPIAALQPLAALSRSSSSSHRAGLRRIRENSCALALWARALPTPVAALCKRLAPARPPLALDVTAASGPPFLAALASAAPFSCAENNAAAHWLLEDIATLAAEFADLAECEKVRVRLDCVLDRGCAVFHMDTLPVRLLCTYAGRGMQWTDEAHVRRSELGLRGRTSEEANAAIVPDAAHIRTMPTGAVAIFKGRLWPGGEGQGLIHRSYPVCCADHARLRLVIDPAGYCY